MFVLKEYNGGVPEPIDCLCLLLRSSNEVLRTRTLTPAFANLQMALRK